MDSSTAAVQMRDITKAFGSVVANDRVWLDIRRGEVLALLGENGSGKTTLMNMLSGIYYPDSGQIYVDGREVFIRSPRDAFVPYSGQVVTHFARRRELGIAEPCVIVDDMAPLYHLRPDCPPMLLLTGDRELELKGRYEEVAYFHRMMRIAQHPDVRLYEFQGFKHGNMPQAGHFVALRFMREILKKRGE